VVVWAVCGDGNVDFKVKALRFAQCTESGEGVLRFARAGSDAGADNQVEEGCAPARWRCFGSPGRSGQFLEGPDAHGKFRRPCGCGLISKY